MVDAEGGTNGMGTTFSREGKTGLAVVAVMVVVV